MSRFFKNHTMFAAIAILFLTVGSGLMNPAMMVAHGPNMPPDPWDLRVTAPHGPNMPPDPWDAA